MNLAHDPLFDLPDDNDEFLNAPSANPHKAIAAEAAKVTLFKRDCKKCGGSGSYGRYTSLGHSKCTLCNGRGFFETKVSPEQADARKARKEARKARDAANKTDAWNTLHPAEAAWMKEAAPSFEFAAKMVAAVAQWGGLTDGQLAAVRRLMLADETRAAERAARNAATEQRKAAVDITPVIAAFDKAGASLKSPKLYTEHFHFSKAPAHGKNPGAIYVKTRRSDDGEGVYLGKIFGGLFTPGRDCTPDMQQNLLQVCEDPLGAVIRYGRLTGRCGICARKLETKESVERGIGPICAEKFGF